MTLSARPSTVVLVPGFSGSPDEYAFVRPMLARRRPAVTVDLSGETCASSFDGHVEQVRRTIRDLGDAGDGAGAGGPRVVLVGSSFGALVATAVAAVEPRVVGLVLLGGWLAPDDRLRDVVNHLLSVRERTPDLLDDVARLLLLSPSAPSPAAAPSRPPTVTASSGPDATVARTARTGPPSATSSLLPADSATATRLGWAQSLDLRHLDVAAPVLVVTGSVDAVVSPALSHELVGTFDDARFAALDAGHAVLAERPAEVLALVEAFVDGRLPPGPVAEVRV